MKVQHGDIVVFHGHSFVSRGIQFFMNVWRWVNLEFKPFYKSVPNHIAMGDNNNVIIEAVEKGIKRVNFATRDYGKKATLSVYRYKWSDQQIKIIDTLYNKYEGTPYQFINFLQYIPYILSVGLLWIGTRGNKSDKKLYCSEFVAKIIHDITVPGVAKSLKDLDANSYFRDYWKVSPLQVSRWCEVNCELVAQYEINNGIITETLY
jgi:hypothetical protein